MGHAGEEKALGPVGSLRRMVGLLQSLVHLLAPALRLVNILEGNGHDAGDRVLLLQLGKTKTHPAIAFPCLQTKLRLKNASQLHKKPGDLMEPQASMDHLPVLRPGSLRQHILAEIVIIASVQVPETAA